MKSLKISNIEINPPLTFSPGGRYGLLLVKK